MDEVGAEFAQGQPFGSIESVKAASDMNLPAGGTITAVNEALADKPEVVNSDPYGAGWIVKFTLSNPGELASLMDAASYEAYCSERG